jgi:hypothetical protein
VMEIANTFPTEAEFQQMFQMQTLYFEYWFQQGEAVSKSDPTALKNHTQITPLMKLAAEWLGEKRNWSNPEILRDAAPCPMCQTLVSSLAYFCPNCSRQIRELPPELARIGEAKPLTGARA